MKNILILGTGGTIAGKSEDVTKTSGYEAAKVGIESLVKCIPGLYNIANIEYEQFCQIPSESMNQQIWLDLSKYINKILSNNVRKIDGIVITHGTDTLEETAYFLNLTVKSDIPVVITGAMYPSTAISADGPQNILNAVTVASSDNSYGKGVLVVMQQKILAARYVSKTSTIELGAFDGNSQGAIGTVTNGRVYYYYQSVKKHTSESEFNIEKIDRLPKVEIIYEYAGADIRYLDYLLTQNDNQGLVIACVGDGSLSSKLKDYIKSRSNKCIIVRSSRIGNDLVIHNGEFNDDKYDTVSSDNLNPQKSRILLMLALTVTNEINEIQRIFDIY